MADLGEADRGGTDRGGTDRGGTDRRERPHPGLLREHDPASPWWSVCRLEDLEVERGATALVHGQAVAIFRMADDAVHALANHDPFCRTPGLARGIVGARDGVPFVASAAHRHGFDLRTGVCLDDGHVAVAAYATRVVDGVVEVGPRQEP